MTEKFNLSNYEKEDGYYPNMAIKEFIRRLKEEIREVGFNYPTAERRFKIIIEKLAGDKLI